MSIPTTLYFIQVSYKLNSGSWANRKCGDMMRTEVNSNFGVGPLNEYMNDIVHSYVLGRCVMLDGSIRYLRPGLVQTRCYRQCLTISNKHLLVCLYSSTWSKIKVTFKGITIHIYLKGKCLYTWKLIQAFRVQCLRV